MAKRKPGSRSQTLGESAPAARGHGKRTLDKRWCELGGAAHMQTMVGQSGGEGRRQNREQVSWDSRVWGTRVSKSSEDPSQSPCQRAGLCQR